MNDTSMPVPLEMLLARCADGDRSAFQEIYDRQSAQLHAVALRITRERGLAADAVQDAFLQIWQRADRFDPDRGTAETWMISLTRYRAVDIIRRQGRESIGVDLPDVADDTPDVLSRLARHREGAALARCLDAIDPERRRLVVLAFINGLTHAELSTGLGTPLGTIKSWIRRSLADLRRCLEA